jgi:hypothetical protein
VKRVDGCENGHTAYVYGHPLGAECEACGHRALMELDKLGSLNGNMKLLRDFKFKCSSWGSRDVSLWLRSHVDHILAALKQAFDIGRHGRPSSLLRVPRRLHWFLWLLAELDEGRSLDG